MSKKNKEPIKKDSRRDFINKGFFASAGWLTGMVNATTETGKKVKMLTPDGKLVEVDESVIKSNPTKKKVNNKDILEWSDIHRSKRDIQ